MSEDTESIEYVETHSLSENLLNLAKCIPLIQRDQHKLALDALITMELNILFADTTKVHNSVLIEYNKSQIKPVGKVAGTIGGETHGSSTE